MGGARSVAADDLIWAPINGISLITPTSPAPHGVGGVTDEAGMMRQVRGTQLGPADTKDPPRDGWVQRMGRSMAVSQRFRKLLGYRRFRRGSASAAGA